MELCPVTSVHPVPFCAVSTTPAAFYLLVTRSLPVLILCPFYHNSLSGSRWRRDPRIRFHLHITGV